VELPAMLYKPGSMFEWDFEWFDYVIVNDQDELDAALADGWVSHKPTAEEEAVVIAKEPARRGRPPKVQADG
jgi:hypothetical protein